MNTEKILISQELSVGDMVKNIENIIEKPMQKLPDFEDIYEVSGLTVKISKGKKYLLVASGDKKCQFVYGGSSAMRKNVKLKMVSLLNDSERPFIVTINGSTPLAKVISEKLGVEVNQYTKEGESLFRVKEMKGFKSLSLCGDGKSIHSISFESSLDYPKDITLDSMENFSKDYMSQCQSRIDAIRNLMNKLNS